MKDYTNENFGPEKVDVVLKDFTKRSLECTPLSLFVQIFSDTIPIQWKLLNYDVKREFLNVTCIRMISETLQDVFFFGQSKTR